MLKVYSIWINWRIKDFLTGLKGFKEWVYGYVLKNTVILASYTVSGSIGG
jgi:hypothetical protein